MTNSLDDYFEALKRLKKGNPKRVTKGTKITNDAVSIEAERKKGSIKKSRPIFSKLIEAINKAAIEQFKASNQVQDQLEAARQKSTKYRVLWEQSLGREASLLYELYETKKQLQKYTGENIITLRKTKNTSS